jgi:DNA repair ATPase RecN
MADNEHGRTSSFADRARAALTTAGKDERLQQAAALTKDVAARAEEASKHVSRMVGQEDAWDELRGDVEVLTELARAHHALIIDLIDRVAALEAPVATQPGGSDGG